MAAILSIYRDLRIFIALVSNPSIKATLYLLNLTIFVNNRYGDLIVFVGWALYRIKFEGLIAVSINDSQSLGYELVLSSVECNDFYFSTEQRFVSWNIGRSAESTILWHWINDSFAIEAIAYILSSNLNAIFINIFSNYANILAKSNLIVNGHDFFVRVAPGPVMVCSIYIKNSVLSFTKFSSSESYSSVIFASDSNTDFILTRNEFSLIAFVPQGVNAVSGINETEVITIKCIALTSVWLNANVDSSIYRTSYSIALVIQNFELNSIGKHSVEIGPVIGIGTSEDIAAGQGSVDILSSSLSSDHANIAFETSFFVGQGDDRIFLILHGKYSVELTVVFGLSRILCEFYNVSTSGGEIDGLIFSRGAIAFFEKTSQGDFIDTIVLESLVSQIQGISIGRFVVVLSSEGIVFTCYINFGQSQRICNNIVGNSNGGGTEEHVCIIGSCISHVASKSCMKVVGASYTKLNIKFSAIVDILN